MRATERKKYALVSSKTDEIEAVPRPFFVEMCHGKIVDLQKIAVFLENLYVQTFVSRTALGAMMARDPWTTESCCCVVSSPSPARPNQVG